MLKLRTILLYDKLYYLIIFLVLLVSGIRIMMPHKSIYTLSTNEVIGTITKINIIDDKVTITVKNKENIIATYYQNKKNNFNYEIGDKVKIIGELSIPSKNTTKYLFNYQKYLSYHKTYYLMNVYNIKLIRKNNNLMYKQKQLLIKYINKNPYLNTFILGDKSYLNKDAVYSYQYNGISHLFAISGMHISLLSSIILKILKKLKIKENKRFFITSIILINYLYITNLSASILRGTLFFILFSLNKIYYFYIKPFNIVLLVLAICLIINPFYLFDTAFWYSFTISVSLIILSKYLNGNYLMIILKTSIISFIVSLPISLYNFNQINLMSIIYNLFFIPLISLIIFPLSLVSIIFPIFIPIYNFLTNIMESISLSLKNIRLLTFIFPRVNISLYIFYYIFIILMFKGIISKQHSLLLPIILLMIFHYIYPLLYNYSYIKVLDVGQGDSILIHNKRNILIDTGGSNKENYSIEKNIISPSLKSVGIKKIDFLILSHGDYDHIGEAINLVENFKVENVIFNCGKFNNLEKKLIKVLDKNKIKYYSCIEELNIDKNKLYFLQTKEYDNENDNSNVIYTELNGYKFMFMGDAGIEKEKDILEKYNLKDIDFFKVGHHGSNTSSSNYFINKINPKYSLISVGKNNRYGHPKESVLDTLKNSTIYRTDLEGSIEIKLNRNGYKIRTCPP